MRGRLVRLPGPRVLLGGLMLGMCIASGADAQGGPPFLANDTGTPGDGHWEINVAAAPSIARNSSTYQLPQFDINYGVGDRLQLTYEIPYLIERSGGQQNSGWSNANPGIKWRFLDQPEGGWQASMFPMFQTGGSAPSVQRGIATSGPRYFLPFEATKRLGDFDLDMEAGYYFPIHGARERIFGVVVGRSYSERLELDAEVYDDRGIDAAPDQTTLDVGGRYKLGRGFIALFMAGRSINGTGAGQPEFFGYFGVQILLSDYGGSLAAEP